MENEFVESQTKAEALSALESLFGYIPGSTAEMLNHEKVKQFIDQGNHAIACKVKLHLCFPGIFEILEALKGNFQPSEQSFDQKYCLVIYPSTAKALSKSINNYYFFLIITDSTFLVVHLSLLFCSHINFFFF